MAESETRVVQVKIAGTPAFDEVVLPCALRRKDVITNLADSATYTHLFHGVDQLMCEVRIGVHRRDSFFLSMEGPDTIGALFPGETLYIVLRLPTQAGFAAVGGAGAVTHTGTIARRLQFPNVDVPCPSEKDAPSIHCERRLLLKPLSLEAGAEVADAFQHVVAAQSTNWDDIMVDDAMYPLATAYKPQWALEAERPRGSEHTAIDVFGCKLTPGGPFELTLPWGCRPELFARTAAGEVAFNGELKSAGDRRTFDGVAAYLLLGMAQSLFDAPPDTWRFYSRPPVGYGIVGYPFAAHFVSVEMIGQIFVAPLSKPFILKSQDHASAAAALPPIDFGAPIDYKRDSLPIIADDETAVVWTAAPTEDGMFLKFLSVKTCSAAGRFASIFRLYQNYSRLPEERPAALLPAEMLFGFLCVAIRMRFVAGRVPTERELWTDPSILNPLAEAIAWLLRHGILYTDVRPPNVIVVETALAAAPKQVYLIDYDDAVLLQESELAAPLTQAAVAAILRGQKEEHAKVSLALWDDALTGAVLRHFPA